MTLARTLPLHKVFKKLLRKLERLGMTVERTGGEGGGYPPSVMLSKVGVF